MIANILGLDPAIAAQSLADITPIKGRGEIYDVKYGSYQCKVINDSYNASPISMKYAIENLMLFGDCNKIIIIANMMELGERAIEYHKNLLEPIINSGVNEVYTVGNLMYELHKILPYNIKTKHFEDYSHLMKHLDEIITSDMLILFKGSNSQNLQKVVTHLVKE
jgi:UDP-N-acetylmuramoyl-tripeptide--D-alanyl-D-alanine ligase